MELWVFNYFRLYKPECADAITFFAREALKYAVVKFHTKIGSSSHLTVILIQL